MKAPIKIIPQKYSLFRKELEDKEEGYNSDEDIEDYSQILNELIPTYYQYRRYLFNIMQESTTDPKFLAKFTLPENYEKQHVKKCKEEHALNEKHQGNNRLKRATRHFVTEKIIQKKRKSIEQEKQLHKRYEGKQMYYLIENHLSKQNSKPIFCQQPTFQAKSQKIKRIKKSSSIEQNLDYNLLKQKQSEQKSQRKSSQTVEQRVFDSPKDQIIIVEDNIVQQNDLKLLTQEANPQVQNNHLSTSNQIEKEHNEQFQQSKVIESVRNNQLNVVTGESIFARRQDQMWEKTARSERQADHRIAPMIKISSPNIVQNAGQKVDDSEDDFDSASSNKEGRRNIVQIQVGQTHSQYNPKYKNKSNNAINTTNFDLFSHKNFTTSNFFQEQVKKLQRQKKKAQILHHEVSVVLGETSQLKIQTPRQQLSVPQQNQKVLASVNWGTSSKLTLKENTKDFLSSAKYLLSQICDLNSRSECYKCLLKNRQYEILKNLSNEDIGKGPIFIKQISNSITSLLKNEEKSQTNIIIDHIFNNQKYISFDEFGQIFTTEMTKSEHSLLSQDMDKMGVYEIKMIVSKLFSVWLEIYYFEFKLRKIAQINSVHIGDIIKKIGTEEDRLSLEGLQKFIYSTSQNKINRLKVEFYFKTKFPSLTSQSLVGWLNQRVQVK